LRKAPNGAPIGLEITTRVLAFRQLVPEHRFSAEILEIRILYPPVAQRLVREIVHVFEDKQPSL
jgi:hypothetical protein